MASQKAIDHDNATIPSELGSLTGMTEGGYFLYNSKLGGTLPTGEFWF